MKSVQPQGNLRGLVGSLLSTCNVSAFQSFEDFLFASSVGNADSAGLVEDRHDQWALDGQALIIQMQCKTSAAQQNNQAPLSSK